ncbi:MAG: hypothetical protein WAT79_06105 [Saprospiraceae bacterium]
MIFAVIDLGSNTFHLMIVSTDATQYKEDLPFTTLYKTSYFVGLSKGGGKVIPAETIENALAVIRQMKNVLNDFNPDQMLISGTAVLRSAENSSIFIDQAKEILEHPILIIDGEKEAQYISKGILLHKFVRTGTYLIMDIGGGSTEFILIQNGQIKWLHSFPLGVGVLYHHFFQTDPITKKNKKKAFDHFSACLVYLISKTQEFEVEALIGTSGTFEALEKLRFGSSEYGLHTKSLSIDHFNQFYRDIMPLDSATRHQYPNMDKERAHLIPAGLLLMKYVIQHVKPKKIHVGHFALKEGMLMEMIENYLLTSSQ